MFHVISLQCYQDLVWSIGRDGKRVFLNLKKYKIKYLKIKKAALLRKSVILQTVRIVYVRYGILMAVTVKVLLSGMCCCIVRFGVKSQLCNHTHLL